MTCTLDPEQIALYIDGDMPADGRQALAGHLSMCAACRALKERLEADRGQIARYASTEVPAMARPGARPRRNWAPAVAAALVLALVFTTQADALGKRLIQLFPFLAIQEMSKEELEEVTNRPGGNVSYPVRYDTVEAAEKVVGYQIARLGQVPEGYKLAMVQVSFPDQPLNSSINTVYARPEGGPTVTLEQTRAGEVVALAEEGSTREVQVHGAKAAIVEQQWTGDEGPYLSRTLFFQWKGQPMHLGAYHMNAGAPEFSDEDLIRMAESLY